MKPNESGREPVSWLKPRFLHSRKTRKGRFARMGASQGKLDLASALDTGQMSTGKGGASEA